MQKNNTQQTIQAKANQRAKNPVQPVRRQRQPRAKQGKAIFPNLSGPLSSAPVNQTRVVRSGRPQIVSARNGDCTIVHREYIQDVNGQTNSVYGATSLSVNPGNASMFPWASKVAANFESYRFKRLKFDYETESATTVTGSLLLSVDFDSSDTTPTSKQMQMAYRGAVRSALWQPCSCICSGTDLAKKKMWFVRPGAQPANTDIKEYDVGKLFVGTQGTNASSLGELYVEYELDLYTPLFTLAFGDAEKITAVGLAGQGASDPFGSGTDQTFTDSGQTLTVMTTTGAGTLTFQRAFSGIMILEYIGTVITAIATVTGTSTFVDLGSSADAGGLKATAAVSIVAASGQTIVFGALTATTVTSATARFVSYPVAQLG